LTSLHTGGQGAASERELRKFGLSTGLGFALILGLLVPWLLTAPIPRWPFVIAGLLIGPALLAPRVLRPIQYWWMWGAEKLGAFNARVVLGIVFYALLTPVGAIRRLLGSDPLGLRMTDAGSFRKPSRRRSPQSMEKPF
jgi:saxitoxin biosynthesis operon SxtJ-like protein